MKTRMILTAAVVGSRRLVPLGRHFGQRQVRRSANRRSLHRRLHHGQRSRDRRQAGGARVESRPRQLQRHLARRPVGRRGGGRRPEPRHRGNRRREGRTSARRCSSTSAPTPAQRIALVAMANELSKGSVGTIVRSRRRRFSSPISGSEIHVSAGAGRARRQQAPRRTTRPAARCSGSTRSRRSTTRRWASPTSTRSPAPALGTKWSDPNKRSAFFGTFS